MGFLSQLLQWHMEDPPDADEIARNNEVCTSKYVYSISISSSLSSLDLLISHLLVVVHTFVQTGRVIEILLLTILNSRHSIMVALVHLLERDLDTTVVSLPHQLHLLVLEFALTICKAVRLQMTVFAVQAY